MQPDPDKLVRVATCASINEANVLKTALEDNGIESVVDGDAISAAFGSFGSTLTDAKLLVRREDARQAATIIRQTRETFSAPRKDPWFCGKCLEEVEGGFEVCWSCGLARDETEAPFPATAEAIATENFTTVDTQELGNSTSNPYESPRAMGTAEAVEEEPDPNLEKAESKMTLAMLFAAASLWLPVIPAFVVLFLIQSANRKRLPVKGRAKSFFWIAISLLVATHLFWIWMIWGRHLTA